MITQICNEDQCTGCFACMNGCFHNAIECGMDENGKIIPKIIEDACTECGLCKKICPVNSHIKKEKPHECYAAWTKDRKSRRIASSGGVAIEFSKYFIENHAVVYGSTFAGEFQLKHTRAETYEEVERFCGSKYVQSYVGKSYRNVKKDLESGKQVLFIGTPCQIAGLKAYLRNDYEKLLTVDLICHGTPPMQYLKEYVEEIVGKDKATEVSFRGKRDYRMMIYGGKKVLYSKRFRRDPYYVAFLQGLISRDNCYSCDYADIKRCSDITIGDFWGIDRKSLSQSYNGKISVVLINTLKGKEMWKKMKGGLIYEKREISEAVAGNIPLRQSSNFSPDRKKFLDNYQKEDFIHAIITPKVEKELERAKIEDDLLHRVVGKIRKILK